MFGTGARGERGESEREKEKERKSNLVLLLILVDKKKIIHLTDIIN